MQKLSVCVIARNEEKFLGGCLASVKDVADELIVVDTGSTDRTKAIARDQGAKIFDHVWKDDFSESRNFALGKATGDWILQLDADERLYEGDVKLLQELILAGDSDAYVCQIVNLVSRQTFDGATIHGYPRLFKAGVFRYSGSIHERLIPISALKGGPSYSDLHIVHWGYLGSKQQAQKGRRNTALLKTAIAEAPNNAYLHYYLGYEYKGSGEYEEAITAFDQAESLRPRGDHSFFAMVVIERCACLRKLDRLDVALEQLEWACQYFFDFRDVHYLAGDIYYEQGQWEKALAHFERCASIRNAGFDYRSTKAGLDKKARKMALDCRRQLEKETE